MRQLTVLVNVQAAPNTPLRRVAGIMDDRRTFAVAVMPEGANVGDTEFAFPLGEAVELSEAILAGDRRAMTTPGLARILASSVAVLFRVAAEAGAIVPDEETDGRGNQSDREEAAADADPGQPSL